MIVAALLIASQVSVPSGPITLGGNGGLSPTVANRTYLRLDTSNDPLTGSLAVSAANTLCSQALSVAFNGDADTGLQRSAANTMLLCAGAIAALTLTTTTAELPSGSRFVVNTGGVATCTSFAASAATTSGYGFDTSNRPALCAGGNSIVGIGATQVLIGNGYGFLLGSTSVGIDTTATNAGQNLRIATAANAAGEYAVSIGSNAALSGATLDTQILDVCYDCDGTPTHVQTVDGAGHPDMNGVAPSGCASGTCTGSETCTGDDFHGTITASCTAQTAIVTFGRAWTTAPLCYVWDQSAIPTALSWTTSTTALTITATGGANAVYGFQCWYP